MPPYTMKPEVGPGCRGHMYSRRWPHQVYAIHMYIHHSHTDRTYSHHWRQQSVIPFSSRLFHDTRVAMLGGVVARSTHDLSSAASRRFPMVLDETANATCAWISSLNAARTICQSWHASALHSHPEPGDVPHTTAESSDTPLIHWARHVQQSVDMSIQLPTGLQCNPVQMAEIVK